MVKLTAGIKIYENSFAFDNNTAVKDALGIQNTRVSSPKALKRCALQFTKIMFFMKKETSA